MEQPHDPRTNLSSPQIQISPYSHSRERLREGGLTPLIINPKQIGNFFQFGPVFVSIGSHKLPGDSVLIVPSATITANNTTEERIPNNEVRDNNLKGKKVVGTKLTPSFPLISSSFENKGVERWGAHIK